ncbi:MAG TPA: serine/threonine-protein kinase [Gemmataceae bacterium]|nr:serine/threonine-protein kinase [Gemmataceae bacterium]
MKTWDPQANDLFLQALALSSPNARQEYLDRTCAGDAALRAEVESLLEASARAGSFLDSPLSTSLATLDKTLLEKPGTMIGPYKLLEQIGEGGMGLVFMAEQEQPLRRKVALKILKPGMDSRQVVARFEAERQALALMDHPHIAKILDAGTIGESQPRASARGTADPLANARGSGRPYFVMELVRGVPITDFCDQRRLTPRQRLELFICVCQAVQHAHQKGIIQRDLKPSNVLVTLHDTVTVPKVIDFGIAKATTQRLTERTLFPHFAQMMGTPLYMSPEQAEMNGLDVDTRSDVYALGVLLYELLTGTTPFESETLKKVGYDEMRRIIREEEPPRPSQRLTTLGAAASATVSERRGVDERRLRQLLHGELAWVVMKALEKDRNRRYESVSALAADVQRYLNDEPVEACPPSVGYRLRKLWRRHRRSLVATGFVAAALVAATAVSVWQAVKARDAERRAASEATIAKAVNDFLQEDLLSQAAPEQQFEQGFAADAHLTVKGALDRAAAKIGARFQDQPLVQAAIRGTIGEAYHAVGEYGLAIRQLEQAIALRKEHLGPGHPDTLHCVTHLGSAYIDVGRYSEAIALHAESLPLFQATFGPEHPLTRNFVWSNARANHKAGNLDEAERLFRAALEISRRQIDGPNTRVDMTFALVWLSRNLLLQKKYAEAEPLAREALEISERDAPDRYFRFVYRSVLGGALLGQEKYAEAEPLLLQGYEGLKKFEAMFGSPWDWRVAEAGHYLVQLYEAMNQPEKAREWREKLSSKKHPDDSKP